MGGWGSKDSRSGALVRTRMPWRRPIAVRLQGGREATLGQDTCVGWLQSRPIAFEWVEASWDNAEPRVPRGDQGGRRGTGECRALVRRKWVAQAAGDKVKAGWALTAAISVVSPR